MTDDMPIRGLNFIAGEWQDSSEHLTVYDPRTGEAFATMACADKEQVEAAVSAANACVEQALLTTKRPVYRSRLLLAMAEYIRQEAENVASLLVRENGKSWHDAKDEILETARYFEYYAGMADKIEGTSVPLGDDYVDFTFYEPQGVSVHIIPWNFPVSICARSLAPALAAGNAVIVKSPELSPLAITLLGKACQYAGLPKGSLSILAGTGSEVGAALVAHPCINHIVFTGSVTTGRSIMRAAAQRAIPCVMELGGKSAAVVYADADLKLFRQSVYWGVFFNAGQVCSAMSRVLVERSIYAEVISQLQQVAQQVTLDVKTGEFELTPLISAAQLHQVVSFCEEAIEQGARLVTGGSALKNRSGYYMQPTVLADVNPDFSIFQQEVFGPVVCVTPFDSEEEAISLANATEYGLVAGVFTTHINKALRAAKKLNAGQVFVNEWFAGGIETPFGGNGLSGYGREKGQEALYSYVRTKNVAIKL